MAEEWREFEKLVARIEMAIGPMGAVVTSHDYLRDSVTGELREVDASYAHKETRPPSGYWSVEIGRRTRT
jgi:hypothetical protein